MAAILNATAPLFGIFLAHLLTHDERLSWTTLLESFGAAREAAALVDALSSEAAWAASVARHLSRVQSALAPANYAETLARCRRVVARRQRPWWRFW